MLVIEQLSADYTIGGNFSTAGGALAVLPGVCVGGSVQHGDTAKCGEAE